MDKFKLLGIGLSTLLFGGLLGAGIGSGLASTKPKPAQSPSFKDLSKDEQAKYLLKQDLDEYGKYITPKSYSSKYSINESDLNGLDEAKLKQLSAELGRKNRALIADNLDLASKNLELISKIDGYKQRFDNKKDELLKSSNDLISKEQQACKSQINECEARFLNLKNDLEEQLASVQLDMRNAQKLAKAKEDELNAKVDEANASAKASALALGEANETISKLSATLNDAEAEATRLKGIIEGTDNELKESNSLFTRELDRINDSFNTQKKALEDALASKTDELLQTRQKLATSQNELKQTSIQASEATTQNKKLKQELEKSAIAYVKLEKENLSLNDSLSALNIVNAELSQTLRQRDESISQNAKSLQEQQNQIEQLSQQNSNLSLNLNDIQSQLDKAQNALKQYRQNYESIQKQLENEMAQNEDLKNRLVLDENLSKISLGINDALSSLSFYLKKASGKAPQKKPQNEDKSPKSEHHASIEEILNYQDKLEDENKNLRLMLDATSKMEAPKKLVLVGTIACNDISPKGNASNKCKNRVSEFLGRFNSNYLYEIVPIVDEKNSTLIKTATKELKPEEAKRLQEYANYGVGRARALMAAQLVKAEYGDFARISFSHELITRPDARGFEIRAYK